MAHCTKCGAEVAENAVFCGACGASQVASGGNPAGASSSSQLAENVASLLCYVLGWVTGLIFFLIDKRPTVRFHAAQSIVVFGGLHIISLILGTFFGLSLLAGGFTGFSFGILLYWLVSLLSFVLWILLMVKAYQGERFRVPIAADVSEKIFGKS